MDQAMPDVLARICGDVMRQVEQRRRATPVEVLRRKIQDAHGATRGFARALKEAVAAGRCGLIAEVKQASPSGGLIRPDFDPATIARSYERAGATCLSVLTEGAHFQGDPAHLRAARAACTLPVLRKDFMVHPWQIYESRAMGADCVLIIMSAVSNALAIEMEGIARSLDMDVLVEVHDRAELDRALGLQTPLIGVNNRDLRTMRTDLHTTEALASFVPPDRMLVSESGIRNADDLHRLGQLGAQCVLVGESLLRQPDLEQAVADLLGPCSTQ